MSIRCIRRFSQSSVRQVRSTELTPALLSSLRANPARLWKDIHSTAAFGIGKAYGPSSEETGLNRLALTKTDQMARDWFTKTTQELNCKIFVDEVGNQFAIRPGLASYSDESPSHAGKFGLDILNVPATFAGSHLDSQPQGGRFDGVLGVCAGVEMLRVLQENWIETEGPVGVVNWTNEEGKRWKRSMMGSGVWADGTNEGLQKCWNLVDETSGTTVKQDLEKIGYLGDLKASATDGVSMAAHFELHIEQAKRLETMQKKVAVVTGGQAYKWYTITVKGREAHAGATPWPDRADAMLWASRAIWEVSNMVKGLGGLATVGCIDALPGSVNVVPGEVRMTLDIRSETDGQLELIERRVKSLLSTWKGQQGEVEFDISQDFHTKATSFHPIAMGFVDESAKSVTGEGETPYLISGAGHDSINTAKHCPSAMIFVPCRDGLTHNIKEWSTEEDCAIGASVLLQSVLRFDQWRHQQQHFMTD
jgi:hydantoinase/carbamoylase family amidase